VIERQGLLIAATLCGGTINCLCAWRCRSEFIRETWVGATHLWRQVDRSRTSSLLQGLCCSDDDRPHALRGSAVRGCIPTRSGGTINGCQVGLSRTSSLLQGLCCSDDDRPHALRGSAVMDAPRQRTRSVRGCIPTRSGGTINGCQVDRSRTSSLLQGLCCSDDDRPHALRGSAVMDAPRQRTRSVRGCIPTRSAGTINGCQVDSSRTSSLLQGLCCSDDDRSHALRGSAVQGCIPTRSGGTINGCQGVSREQVRAYRSSAVERASVTAYIEQSDFTYGPAMRVQPLPGLVWAQKVLSLPCQIQ